jgi:hypothetical protein
MLIIRIKSVIKILDKKREQDRVWNGVFMILVYQGERMQQDTCPVEEQRRCTYLCLDSELAGSRRNGLADLTDGLTGELLLGKGTAHGAGLLSAEILGEELGASEGLLGSGALLLGDDSVDAGDGLADMADHGDLVGTPGGDLLDAEGSQLGLEILELSEELSLILGGELGGLDLESRLHSMKKSRAAWKGNTRTE